MSLSLHSPRWSDMLFRCVNVDFLSRWKNCLLNAYTCVDLHSCSCISSSSEFNMLLAYNVILNCICYSVYEG